MEQQRKYIVTYAKQIADKYDKKGDEDSGDKTKKKKFINPQIGVAYELPDGDINMVINAIPLSWNGKAKLRLRRESEEYIDDEE